MKIDDVKVAKGPLVTASANEVDALEAKLWLTFPEGYREYVARLGEGYLNSVRIYPPWRIEKELQAWRRRVAQYWFWDEGPQILPQERGVECVCVGDTLGGDELVFHPSRPDRLFVLPRDAFEVFEAGADLLSAVEWMLTPGNLIGEDEDDEDEGPTDEGLIFEAFDSRLIERDEDDEDEAPVDDPPGGSMDDLIDVARVWADRHRLREIAERCIAEDAPKAKRGAKATRQCEALVFDTEKPGEYDLGYMAIYKLIDEKTEKAAGSVVFRWSEGSYGATFG